MWDVYCPDLRRRPLRALLCHQYTARSLTYALLFSSVNRWAGLIVFPDLRFQATAAVTSTGKSTEKVPIHFTALGAPDCPGVCSVGGCNKQPGRDYKIITSI